MWYWGRDSAWSLFRSLRRQLFKLMWQYFNLEDGHEMAIIGDTEEHSACSLFRYPRTQSSLNRYDGFTQKLALKWQAAWPWCFGKRLSMDVVEVFQDRALQVNRVIIGRWYSNGSSFGNTGEDLAQHIYCSGLWGDLAWISGVLLRGWSDSGHLSLTLGRPIGIHCLGLPVDRPTSMYNSSTQKIVLIS